MTLTTQSEAARRVGRAGWTIRRWIQEGQLKRHNGTMVALEDVQALCASHRAGRKPKGTPSKDTAKPGRRSKADFRLWDDEKANKAWEGALKKLEYRDDDGTIIAVDYLPPLRPTHGTRIKIANGQFTEVRRPRRTITGDTEAEAFHIAVVRLLAHLISPSAHDKRKLDILPEVKHATREMTRGRNRGLISYPYDKAARWEKRLHEMADAGGKPGDTARLFKLWHCAKYYPSTTLLDELPVEKKLHEILKNTSPRAILAIAGQIVERALREVPPTATALFPFTNQERTEIEGILKSDRSPREKRRALSKSHRIQVIEGKKRSLRHIHLFTLLGCKRELARHWKKVTRQLLHKIEHYAEASPVAKPHTEASTQDGGNEADDNTREIAIATPYRGANEKGKASKKHQDDTHLHPADAARTEKKFTMEIEDAINEIAMKAYELSGRDLVAYLKKQKVSIIGGVLDKYGYAMEPSIRAPLEARLRGKPTEDS